ncbi:MAG TPA: hypothetical protein VK358_12835 [Longimicrobium sp.]|nr:hypothetical protein [Longimicrobium sp.]
MEVLREFVRSYAELSSIRHVADDAGVGRSTVHQFITASTTPQPRVRRLLALWYLRRLNGGVDEVTLLRPYRAALAVLLADVPEPSRDRVTADVLGSIGRGFTSVEEAVPGWIDVLLRRTPGIDPARAPGWGVDGHLRTGY